MVKAMVFPIVMCGCETTGKEVVLLDWKNILYFYLKYWKSIADYQEGWTLNCFQTVVLEKILESPLNCKETKLVNRKGNQFWIFIGRIVAGAEASIFWPPDVKSLLTGKDAGKDQRQKEKRVTEDTFHGWPHWHKAYTSEQISVDSKGQGSLVCCIELQWDGSNLATGQHNKENTSKQA